MALLLLASGLAEGKETGAETLRAHTGEERRNWPAWQRESTEVLQSRGRFSGNPGSPVPQGARSPGAKAREQARSVLQDSPAPSSAQERASQQKPTQTKAVTERKTLVFVSFSIGRRRLKALFADLGGISDVVFVLRGILKGTHSLGPTFRAIHKLIAQVDSRPHLIIDPTKFRDYAIQSVPAVAVVASGKLLGKARGTTAYRAMHRRIEQGSRGDFGKWGETQEIAEADLIQVIAKRASQLDPKRIKRRIRATVARYWAKKGLEDIPEVEEPRTRTFEPVYQASRTVRGPQGQVIFTKGDQVNMLRVKGFHKVLIAFDGTEADQVGAVERILARTGQPVILAASRVADWDAFSRLQGRFGKRLFRLPPALRRRFRIERLPTVVKAKGNKFVVKEVEP